MEVIIKINQFWRIKANNMSGFDLEAYVEGIGWVLDNDNDVSDDILMLYINQAKTILSKIDMGVKA